LHNSMARCFKILHRINSAYLTEEDIEANYAGLEIDPSDFDGPMDVIPVSDPQIFSDTQRFVQTQALMQRAALLPQMYDQRKVEERFLRDMKIPENEVLQPKPGSEDMDPVSENVAAAMGRPIYVLPKQDHMAHLQTHVAFLKSPLFGSNPAIVKQYLYPMSIHLRDHLLNYYLVEAHNAVDMAERDQLIQSEANEQVQVILKVQQFIEQQLGSFANELAQIDQAAQQFKPQPPMPPDNSMQIAQINPVRRSTHAARAAEARSVAAVRANVDGGKGACTSAGIAARAAASVRRGSAHRSRSRNPRADEHSRQPDCNRPRQNGNPFRREVLCEHRHRNQPRWQVRS